MCARNDDSSAERTDQGALPTCEPSALPTELILIRHGETTWNAEKRLQGQKDVPLSDLGRAQVRELAVNFESILAATPGTLPREAAVAAVYSSDLQRAAETATILCAELRIPADRIRHDVRFREWNAGHMEGHYIADVQQKFAESWSAWSRRDCAYTGHGGETLFDKYERVTTALGEICREYRGRRVIIVTHSLVIDDAIRLAKAIPLQNITRMPKKNAGVYILHATELPSGQVKWALLRAADKVVTVKAGRKHSVEIPTLAPGGSLPANDSQYA